MEELICIMCPHARFLDPKKEICWKTGGLYCRVLDRIVAKYDPCHDPEAAARAGKNRKSGKRGRGAGGGPEDV